MAGFTEWSRTKRINTATVKKKSFDEYQTGDKDPQQDVGEDGQEGSQQLTINWVITRMENTDIPAGAKDTDTSPTHYVNRQLCK